jgi:hypothetical protein
VLLLLWMQIHEVTPFFLEVAIITFSDQLVWNSPSGRRIKNACE